MPMPISKARFRASTCTGIRFCQIQRDCAREREGRRERERERGERERFLADINLFTWRDHTMKAVI